MSRKLKSNNKCERFKNPECWSKHTRKWEIEDNVWLNPEREEKPTNKNTKLASKIYTILDHYVDIHRKSGVYRYVESDDFEILLFGYSVDGGGVKVVAPVNNGHLILNFLYHFMDCYNQTYI